MTGRFKIKTSSTQELYAELTGENPLTAKAFWNSLPIDGKANTWGDEIYFSIPIKMGSENPKEIVKLGDVAYWPPGQAICFFFGPTPASWNEDIRPASPVNVFARIEYNVKLLKLVHPGERITLEKT